MGIDYYVQDLENGGYKLDRRIDGNAQRVFDHSSRFSFAARHDVGWPYPQSRLMRDLKFMKVFGGFQKCETPITEGSNPFIRVVYVPKLAPLMVLDRKMCITVAGHKVYVGWIARLGQNMWRDISNSIKSVHHAIRNLDKDGYPRDPVNRNTDRAEWVEKAMYQMGFSRSNYKPTFQERFPYVNVGTIGHRDHPKALTPNTIKATIKEFLHDF